MSAKLQWSAYSDGRLRHLRLQGHGWMAIAASLGVSVNAAMERGRTVGALLPRRVAAPVVEDDWDRPPLGKGHAISWGAITAGTVLEGEAYPRQSPMGRIPTGIIGELC